jgi:ABC-type multidrug transport system fused ATPase/permease subunit
MNNFERKYYDFWTKLYRYEKRITLIEVDFEKPWWTIIWKQRFLFCLLLSSIALSSILDSWIIVWLSKALENLDTNMFGLIIFVRILSSIFFVIVFNWNPIFQLTTTDSVAFSSNQKVLTTDPIFHTTKSSGVILSKISKGSMAFEGFLDVITFELFGMIIGSISTIILLFGYNYKLGIVGSSCFVILAIFSIFSNIWNNKVFKSIQIKAEDEVSQATFETLSQASFVRSVYGSDKQLRTLKSKVQDHIGKRATLWEVSGNSYVIIRILFFVCTWVMGLIVIDEIKLGTITPAVGIALITTFVIISKEIQNIGNQVKKFTENKTRITDLFEYMRSFGKQTYPVLEDDDQNNQQKNHPV